MRVKSSSVTTLRQSSCSFLRLREVNLPQGQITSSSRNQIWIKPETPQSLCSESPYCTSTQKEREKKKMQVFLEIVGLQEFRTDSRLYIMYQLNFNILESCALFVDPTLISGNMIKFFFSCQLNFHDLSGYVSPMLKGLIRIQRNFTFRHLLIPL